MSAWTAIHMTDMPVLAAIVPGLLVHLVHELGLFAILIVLFSLLDRPQTKPSPTIHQFLLGLVFAAGIAGVMSDPIVMGPGIIVDVRGAIIALSALFGGPIAAVITAALVAGLRWWIGGAGTLPAFASVASVCTASILVAHFARRAPGGIGIRHLLLLAVTTCLATTVAMRAVQLEPELASRLALALAVPNTIAILVIGAMLRQHQRNRQIRDDLTGALSTQSELAERHRIITDNVADGIVTVDETGTIHSFNSAAEWMFGVPAADVTGRDVSVLMPELGPNGRDTAVHRYLKTGKAQVLGSNGELEGKRRDGSTFPMELRIAEFRLEGRRYFTASIRDLAKVKAAEHKKAKAQAALRDSEARFRDCARVSSDYLWQSDAEHRFTSWEGGDQIPNLYHDGIIGRQRWDVANADPIEEPWAQHIATLELRRPFRNFVFSAIGPDGETRWIRSSGTPFLDEAGQFAGYRGASSDITDAVEAQRDLQARAQQQQSLALLGQLALRESEPDRLFKAAFDILMRTLDVQMVGLFDKMPNEDDLLLSAGTGWIDGSIGQARVACSWSSLPGAAFLSKEAVTIQDSASEATVGRSELASRHHIVSGMACGIGDVARRSGAIMVAALEPRAFTAEEATFLEALSFILGAAAERRRAEASLRLRDRALESIGQGLVIADATLPEAPAVYMNSVFERARGGGPAELLGWDLTELFGSEDDPTIVARIGGDLRERGSFSGRLRTRHGRDKDTWEDVAITRLCDERGALTHFVAVQTDVTARVEMEAELLQARKMDAVGKLTGGVAHDFNNLLTVIIGNAEILAEELTDPKSKLTAEMVLTAAERGSDLVQRLLAFGRRQALQPEYISLDRSVADLAALLRRTIGEEVVLRTELRTDGQTTYIDKSQLETAILNLATNARDAMKGGGTLTISTEPVEIDPDEASLELKAGRYLALVVTDTGHGMAREVEERAFEPFFTTKELGKGTGLGLSTVYGFVQQSGGHVRILTEVGRGTSIQILLPHASGSLDGASEASAEPASTAGERVLLVEDQDDVRSFVTAQLTSFGYDVVSAPDAQSAIDVLREDRSIQLLFSDILLPAGLDGIELAECALVSRPDLKVLFTSGYSDYAVERQSRLLDSGVPLLKKPYKRLELASAVREALERPCVG